MATHGVSVADVANIASINTVCATIVFEVIQLILCEASGGMVVAIVCPGIAVAVAVAVAAAT